MDAKHTLGPWYFDAETGEVTCTARSMKVGIAKVDTGFSEPFETEQQANARLIATTPDLLRSLIDCEARLALLVASGRSKMLDAVAAEHARAVIAAALGHNAEVSGGL